MKWRDRLASWISPSLAGSVRPDGVMGWDDSGQAQIIGPNGEVLMNADIAARVSAVFACVSIIADSVGSLPLDIYLESEGVNGETRHKLHEMLNYQPNPLQTGADFWQEMVFNAVLHGEAVAEPVPEHEEIWPLPWSKLQKSVEERAVGYTYKPKGGESRTLSPTRLFRFGGLSIGLEHVVPYLVASRAISFAKALEEQGERFFNNAARPSGVIEGDKALKDEAAVKRLANQFRQFYSGSQNAGKVAVLEDGFKFNPLQMTNTDAQFIELRKHQIREIAMFWHIPMYLLGDASAGKTTAEQQAQDYVKYCIRPLARKMEQAIRRDLLTEEERKLWRVKFNLEGLLRGDSQTRARNYVLWRTASMASVNTCRAHEGLPPIPEAWADDPREPLNSNRAADTMTGGQTAPQDQENRDD